MMKAILALSISCIFAMPALAQTMPPPKPAPHVQVSRETVLERRTPPHDVQGQALVLDGERLRIDSTELRLFGIVPPQLSASFGPQARASLDQLVGGGQIVSCHIRDRDHDGRLLATCKTAAGVDPALELLRRGLAVAARGSLTDSEWSQPYINAEQTAQNERLGLWSLTMASPPPATALVTAPVAVQTPVIIEGTKSDKVDMAKNDINAKLAETAKDVQAKTASSVMVPVKLPPKVETKPADEDPSLFARYQILIAGSLMLLTTLTILGAFAIRRRNEKRDEMKALAAALRGELQAARAVCMTRVKSILNEDDDYHTPWPRIRSTLYQAYVGKLGWLGAELARQIASIYGQASDYASYYNNLNDTVLPTPKRQALLALATHIDKVLPRLAAIEQTGHRIDALPPARKAPLSPPASQSTRPQRALPSEEVVMEDVPADQYAEQHVEQAAKQTIREPVQQAIEPDIQQKQAQPVTAQPQTAGPENKLSLLMRQFRDRFVEPMPATVAASEPVHDYAASIEEEAERFAFSDENSELETLGRMGRP